ncbi:MAG: hypothetical protein ACRDN9_16225 [Streptosporangiaceae bacterium]
MSELPADDPHETIHLGDRTAVVVPVEEYPRSGRRRSKPSSSLPTATTLTARQLAPHRR